MKTRLFLILLAVLGSFSLTSCGGGGGGHDYVGAAQVTLEAKPNEIDTGDRTRLSIRIWNVHKDGIALKVRFPGALNYVPNSASLNVNGTKKDFAPTVNQSEGNNIYLVFYFEQALFGQDGGNTGILTLELKGIAGIKDGLIEVDPDVDDPEIPNNSEFDINNPEFDAEAEDWISVNG